MNEKIEEILVRVSAATGPSRMSAREALDFIVELRDELNLRIDAFKNDLELAGESELRAPYTSSLIH
jgi:hypothetical protein